MRSFLRTADRAPDDPAILPELLQSLLDRRLMDSRRTLRHGVFSADRAC